MSPPTLVAPATAPRGPFTSALGAPSRRSSLPRLAAGFVGLLVVLAATGLVVLRTGTKPAREPAASRPAAVPARPPAAPVPTPVASAPEATRPSPDPTSAPLRVLSPTRAPDPALPAPLRPVTLPERLTPEPPFEGAVPAGCSGAAVTVGFAVDAGGSIVAPRLYPSDAAPECGRFVLEALPRWRWRPAVDADGAAVLSRRLVVFVRLP